jgi:hypothetical protein
MSKNVAALIPTGPTTIRFDAMTPACHAALFHGTALLLWLQHRPVFRAAGRDFPRFWADAGRTFARLQAQIRQVTMNRDSLDDDRTD